MRISASVEDDARGPFGLRLVDPVDQLTFVVGLAEFHIELVASGGIARECLDVLQCCAAIGLRLARAEQIEVRAVEHKDDFRHKAAAQRNAVPAFYRRPPRKGKPGAIPGLVQCCAGGVWKLGARFGFSRCRFGRLYFQQFAWPHRAMLTFSLSVASPTAPITASLPIT